ncbi:MAG: hypothetical protein UF438_06150 [Oribacterium sp.]|nr:hypothetical protein [Oribacterium sp.]
MKKKIALLLIICSFFVSLYAVLASGSVRLNTALSDSIVSTVEVEEKSAAPADSLSEIVTDSLDYQEIRASVEATVLERNYAHRPDAVPMKDSAVFVCMGVISVLFNIYSGAICGQNMPETASSIQRFYILKSTKLRN